MHTRISIGLTPVALAVVLLTLGACAAPSSDPIEEIIESAVDAAPDIAAEASEDSHDSSTEGLSQEAIDAGHVIVEMPSGWPAELPLPAGNPVVAYRAGTNFSLIFDLPSVTAGEKVIAWYEGNGWTLNDDIEMEGIRVMTFGSPETNDYGPLRRATLGLGMLDWPTGFQYSIEVQE